MGRDVPLKKSGDSLRRKEQLFREKVQHSRRPRGGKHSRVSEKPRAAKKTAGPKGGGGSRRRPEAAPCSVRGAGDERLPWQLGR